MLKFLNLLGKIPILKEFEWFKWFEWFGPSPIEPFNSGRNRELRCRCSRSFSFRRERRIFLGGELVLRARLLLLSLLLGRLQGRLGLDLLALDEQVLNLLELYLE